VLLKFNQCSNPPYVNATLRNIWAIPLLLKFVRAGLCLPTTWSSIIKAPPPYLSRGDIVVWLLLPYGGAVQRTTHPFLILAGGAILSTYLRSFFISFGKVKCFTTSCQQGFKSCWYLSGPLIWCAFVPLTRKQAGCVNHYQCSFLISYKYNCRCWLQERVLQQGQEKQEIIWDPCHLGNMVLLLPWYRDMCAGVQPFCNSFDLC